MKKISIVIPCYNEQEALPLLVDELEKLIIRMKNDATFEIILVDNCSEDDTLKIMKKLHKKDKKYRYISFSRNFGKDSSIYAGLKASTGDFVTIMDADLQDPPELLIEMYKILKSGDCDCVATRRKNRKGEPLIRSMLADIFYKVMQKISDYEIVSGARDFRLMTRKMVNAVLEMEETVRFTKGIFAWVGFKTTWIAFENKERSAGKTKLPMKNAISYAMRGIVAFSTVPLLLASVIGMIFCFAALIYTVVIVFNHFILNNIVSGYSSLMCVLLFGFGLVLLILGIIGQYLAQMYLEVKRRPKYIIKESC